MRHDSLSSVESIHVARSTCCETAHLALEKQDTTPAIRSRQLRLLEDKTTVQQDPIKATENLSGGWRFSASGITMGSAHNPAGNIHDLVHLRPEPHRTHGTGKRAADRI